MSNNFDVRDAARVLKQRTASVEDKLDRIERRDNTPRRIKAPTPGGTTTDQALRSESTGTKGERAFGAPIRDDVPRLRKAQSTDDSN